MEKYNHILTEKIKKDIADTKAEMIKYKETRIIAEAGVNDRQKFIIKLEALLKYREEKDNDKTNI